MKIVVQKVKKCTLYSNGEKYSEIKNGMLVLVGVTASDTEQTAQKIAQKILKLRIFDDENGKTNKNIFLSSHPSPLTSKKQSGFYLFFLFLFVFCRTACG